MNRFTLPLAVLIAAFLAGVVLAGEIRVIVTLDPPDIFRCEVISETDTHIEIKRQGEVGTRKIPKDKIWKNLSLEEYRKQEREINKELRKRMGIIIPGDIELPKPAKAGKSHEIDKIKFTWVSAVVSPIELEAPAQFGGFFLLPPTKAAYLVINYEIENGTSKRLNVKGMVQRMSCVGTAKTDKNENLEQVIFNYPYKDAPGMDPRLAKGDKMLDSIFFQTPSKEVAKVTVRLDTDRIMHCGGGHLVLTVPMKEGAVDNAGSFDMTFEEKPKKKRTRQMIAEVLKDVTFEITDIASRMVREEKTANPLEGPSIDLAGEKLVIGFTVHNKSKSKVKYIPILALMKSYSQVARDNKGQTIRAYDPPGAYVCGRIRPTGNQPQVTLEPGEMVADIVVLDPPTNSAKFVRYLLDVTALFPKSKLDAMFNVKIYLRNGEVNARKKPKFTLLKKRFTLTEKMAFALVKQFVKNGAEKFGERSFGYRVRGRIKVTRIESSELQSGETFTVIYCEVGTDYSRGNKTSYMIGLMKIGSPPRGIAEGNMITYKGAIIGGSTLQGQEGPEQVVLIALKEAKKS